MQILAMLGFESDQGEVLILCKARYCGIRRRVYMESLEILFSVSGVKTNILLPPLVAMVISFFTSMGGVSGAFLLLPFQVSYLGFVSPSVSSTNLVYNIVAIPSGVYRYIKEGRMYWPLTWVIILGTLPGVFAGYFIRVVYLPDPTRFMTFAGFVLLYIGGRLTVGLIKEAMGSVKASPVVSKDDFVKPVAFSIRRVEFEFMGERHGFSTAGMFGLALVVGVVGGTYGIGGGAIIAPFCVAVFRLPVYAVAGSALMGTLITSVAGVIFYSIIPSTQQTSPDWALGALFGAGGFVGVYLGARFQRFVPQVYIKIMLAMVLLSLALKYLVSC